MPELAGQEEPFPEPDNQSKMKRSCENAEHVGELFMWHDANLVSLDADRRQGFLHPMRDSTSGMSRGAGAHSTIEALGLPPSKSTTTTQPCSISTAQRRSKPVAHDCIWTRTNVISLASNKISCEVFRFLSGQRATLLSIALTPRLMIMYDNHA